MIDETITVDHCVKIDETRNLNFGDTNFRNRTVRVVIEKCLCNLTNILCKCHQTLRESWFYASFVVMCATLSLSLHLAGVTCHLPSPRHFTLSSSSPLNTSLQPILITLTTGNHIPTMSCLLSHSTFPFIFRKNQANVFHHPAPKDLNLKSE